MKKGDQAKGNIDTSQLSHLYTIWRYDHNPDTIIDHKEKLREHGQVRWLILCGRDDKNLFEESLPKEELEKIRSQAKEKETVLYIQCLELFREQLYAGLIDDIEVTTDGSVKFDDPLLPEYYMSLIKDDTINLNVICSILLTKLEPVVADEVFNLIEREKYIPKKHSYNMTRIVSQYHSRSVFNKRSVKDRKPTDDQRRRERCRAIAQFLWMTDQGITIADMIFKDEITTIGCEGKNYGEKIVRSWINDLCPNRNPGRRPK